MKLLIFYSTTTKATYSYNGKEVVTIIGTQARPVGKIMKGIPHEILDDVYLKNKKTFKVGEADYLVLKKIKK